jgi:hypothetical protein
MSTRLNPMPKFWNQPEAHIALYGFLLAFLWENLQMPFYDMAELSCWQRTLNCTRASFADAGIMVFAYSTASMWLQNRNWMHGSVRKGLPLFLVAGLLITAAIEEVATRMSPVVGWSWRYSELMPVVPGTQTGLVPFVMWLAVPLAALWIARRQPRAMAVAP